MERSTSLRPNTVQTSPVEPKELSEEEAMRLLMAGIDSLDVTSESKVADKDEEALLEAILEAALIDLENEEEFRGPSREAEMLGGRSFEGLEGALSSNALMEKFQEIMDPLTCQLKMFALISRQNFGIIRLIMQDEVCPIPVSFLCELLGAGSSLLGVSAEMFIKILGLNLEDTRYYKVLNRDELSKYLEVHFSSLMNPMALMTQPFMQVEGMLVELLAKLPQVLEEKGLITFISCEEGAAEVKKLSSVKCDEVPLLANIEVLKYMKIPSDHPYYKAMIHDPHFEIEFQWAMTQACGNNIEKLVMAFKQIDSEIHRKEGQSCDEMYENYGTLLKFTFAHHFKGDEHLINLNAGEALLARYKELIPV